MVVVDSAGPIRARGSKRSTVVNIGGIVGNASSDFTKTVHPTLPRPCVEVAVRQCLYLAALLGLSRTLADFASLPQPWLKVPEAGHHFLSSNTGSRYLGPFGDSGAQRVVPRA